MTKPTLEELEQKVDDAEWAMKRGVHAFPPGTLSFLEDWYVDLYPQGAHGDTLWLALASARKASNG